MSPSKCTRAALYYSDQTILYVLVPHTILRYAVIDIVTARCRPRNNNYTNRHTNNVHQLLLVYWTDISSVANSWRRTVCLSVLLYVRIRHASLGHAHNQYK